MTKIAILADSHLIHAYHKKYDKISEFRRFIDLVLEKKPELIIVLGDFFDKKFTSQGRPISHIEGSKSQIPIVEIIKETKIPWYALLGNHEDKYVLKSLAQSAQNFFYMETDLDRLTKTDETDRLLLETNNSVFWFGNVEINQNYRKKEQLLRKFCQVASRYDSKTKSNVLLLHIDLIRRSASQGLEDNLVKTLADSFKLVINGHEHTYLKKYRKFQNVICVPPSLPTWVFMGRGSVLKYEFKDGKLNPKGNYKDTHGFLILDDDDFTLEFIPFRPIMPTIEVSYDVTGKNLSEIDEEFRRISKTLSQNLIGRYNIQSLIIIPIFTGDMEHLYILDANQILDTISNEVENIEFVDIREEVSKRSSLVIKELGENEIMNTEAIFSQTLDQVKEIQRMLKEKDIQMTDSNIKVIVSKMKDLDKDFFYIKASNKNTQKYISEIIEPLLSEYNDILKASFSASRISNLIEESFKKR